LVLVARGLAQVLCSHGGAFPEQMRACTSQARSARTTRLIDRLDFSLAIAPNHFLIGGVRHSRFDNPVNAAGSANAVRWGRCVVWQQKFSLNLSSFCKD
jgi:hypothetical protein